MGRRPNILWIVTTQWRSSALGLHGDRNASTPWLDGFASEAVDFVNAVTPHPLGPQARAALLTGHFASDNGVIGYWDSLPLTSKTVAHHLNALGYKTAFVGKWHLSERDRSAPLVGESHARSIVRPENRGGFSYWEGFEGGFLLNDPWLHGSLMPVPKQFRGYQSDVLVERTADWTQRCTASPYFAVVSLEAPHPPYAAPAAGIAKQSASEIILRSNVPLGGAVEKQARSELAGYYAHIAATDRSIGRLLSETDLTNTFVVFTSVHGDMHGSHGLFRKAWPYEESISIPLLIRRPGGEKNAICSRESVSLVDLSAMAIAWATDRPWAPRPIVSNISMPSVLSIPLQCNRAWRGIRTSDQKLVLNADGSPWLYFDLERDPFEMNNLADQLGGSTEFERLRRLI